MKTILRIVIILLVAALTAGGYTLVVNNTGLASNNGPALAAADGQQLPADFEARQPPAGFEGREDRAGGSSGALLGVLGTLVKISAVAGLVILLEKGVGLLKGRKLRAAGTN